jgi:M6 family metalloprotease-like protein
MKIRSYIFLFSGLIALLLAAGLATTVLAAPAAPIDITLTQPDGSTFIARQWGDEWSNGFETLEGYTIIQDSANWWVYAQTSPEEILIPALQGSESLRVGMLIPEGLTLHARPATLEATHPLSKQSFIQTPNSGSQPVLVLLASFSNRSGTYTAANFAASMFGASNSVKDYYQDASFNQLTLAAATESYGTANDGIVGWLNLGYNHPNTANSTNSNNQLIVKNALIAADSFVNYASYDTNGDGYISNNELHIVVIVAGFEYSYNNNSPSVWGHRWNLNAVTPPTLDGKVLGDYFYNGGYAQFGEIHGDHQAAIGIMVHEMGHDLTWPDLYDTDGSSEGVGKWSIMGSGSWNYTGTNYQGSSPALADAWLKWYQGWITPTVVNGTLTGASIPQAETNATAFLLAPNPDGVDWNFTQSSGTGEYFLVENRQLTGYDAGLPGCGLNIWHIDESVTSTNSANANEYHPLVKMMEADGLNHLVLKTNRGDTGDPFPGSTTNRTFNYSSTPNSRLYSGADSLVAVTSISDCGATMTANLTYSGVTFTHHAYLPLVRKPGGITPPNTILNGDFEAGQVSWTEFSTHGWSLIINSGFPGTVTPHGGSWAVWLGGDYNDTSSISQTVMIPAGRSQLHFWYWIGSEDVCGYDYFRVYADATLVGSWDLCSTTTTSGWTKTSIDLSALAGSSKEIKFAVITDGSLNSNLFLDDVSFEVLAATSQPVLSSEPFMGAARSRE